MCSGLLVPIYWSDEYKCYYVWKHDIDTWEQLHGDSGVDLNFQIYNRTCRKSRIMVYTQESSNIRSYEFYYWDDEFQTYWFGPKDATPYYCKEEKL